MLTQEPEPEPPGRRRRRNWAHSAIGPGSPWASSRMGRNQRAKYLPARFAPWRSATTAATAAWAPTTTAVTAAAKAIPAAPATRARFPRTGFVYRQCPPTQLGAVQGRHGFIGVGIHRHFDKSETSSLTGIPVFYNLHSIHLAIC